MKTKNEVLEQTLVAASPEPTPGKEVEKQKEKPAPRRKRKSHRIMFEESNLLAFEQSIDRSSTAEEFLRNPAKLQHI